MAFGKWLNKLDTHSRRELLSDLLDEMSAEEKAFVIDEIATQLNDEGFDWGAGKSTGRHKSTNLDWNRLNKKKSTFL